MSVYNMSEFAKGFLVALLWSETYTDSDGDEVPFDREYEIRHIDPSCIESAVSECAEFQQANSSPLSTQPDNGEFRQGVLFLLTRNRHGAGYWDGDYSKDVGNLLTENAHKFSELHLEIGDDGLLYIYKG